MIKRDTFMRAGELWYSIKYQLIYDITEHAIHFLIGKKLVWLPMSQIVYYKKSKSLELPAWLYDTKFLKKVGFLKRGDRIINQIEKDLNE